jgi:hypothetical protein
MTRITIIVLAALIAAGCTVRHTPQGTEVCTYTPAGIACTLHPPGK